jgi:hypothetical protein
MISIRVQGSPNPVYGASQPQIDWQCGCHPGRIAGSAERVGLRSDNEQLRPVYKLSSFLHPEVRGDLVTLYPDELKQHLP